jgi:hypothetical protein
MSLPVSSEAPWSADTGIDLNIGDHVSIAAPGQVQVSRAPLTVATPNGQPWNNCANTPNKSWSAPGVNCWSSVGRIGSTGEPFEVGSVRTFTAPVSGRLISRHQR